MKIAVNTRLLIENKLDGIGWFTFETLKRISQKHPEHEFYFLFDRKYSDKFIFTDNIIPIVIKPPARHPILWYIWFQFSVKKALKKINADIFLSPDGYVSLRSKLKQIAVIHDINFVHRPLDLPYFARTYYNYFFPKFAQHSHKIITVSEYSKQDIKEQFHISEDKITVAYNGCNELYKPVDDFVKSETKNKYTDGKDFFIFIGTLHPRKNIARLFSAFDLFKSETNSDFKLVIVGTKLFLNQDMEKAYSDSVYKQDIIFTGRLNPENLHHVLASAFAMTFVPLFEGFGIPLIEAMNCDVPVISSNTTALPEVAGDAALFVNPFSIEEIKNAMIQLTNDTNFRQDLIEKGRIRKKMFSWEKTAEEVWNVIEDSF